jgi:predicted flap endonuclease-1-like 5' DNA nuclease
MNNLIILIAQTKSEAVIEILSLLSVAAIIGYLTAWLYYKTVNTERIKNLEFKKAEFKSNITSLNTDKNHLKKNLRQKDSEMEHLLLEIKALKALHKEAVHETDNLMLKTIRTEQLLYEKDEALVHIAKRKHLLDYKSFGTATELEKDDLKMISGIGPFIEERLHALDIYTFSQISKFSARDIDTINDAIEFFSGRIQRDEWVLQADELLIVKVKKAELLKQISEKTSQIIYNRIGTAQKEEADDLTAINGIGGWIKEKLNALNIFTFKQISNFTDDDVFLVTEAIEFFPGRIERDEWILQATELVRIAGKKSELLKHIRERRDLIYFDRLGIAHSHQANNLTLIKGIGLWIEERLNALDIYTFEQISKLTPTDVATISEILQISASRIYRDNWVFQARGLSKKQLIAESVS